MKSCFQKWRGLFLCFFLFVFLGGCGGGAQQVLEGPESGGSGKLAPNPADDPNAVVAGCVLNFATQIFIAVDSAKTDIPRRLLQGTYTLPLRLALPNQISIRASDFPRIVFPLSNADTGVGFDVDVVIDAGGTADPTVARGTLGEDGQIFVDGLNLRVRFFTAGQGTSAGDSEAGILQFLLPSVELDTGTVTANLGNGSPLMATGQPLGPDKNLKLVMAAVIPNEPQLAGSIGGGNVVAEFEGAVDKLPEDSICQNGSIGPGPSPTGPSAHLEIIQVVGGVDQPLQNGVVNFGTVEVAPGRSSTVTLKIKNTGETSLSIQGMTFFDNTAPFELTAPPITSIPPGGFTLFTLRFAPTDPLSGPAKKFETTFFINSNDPLQPLRGLLLSGTAKPPSGQIRLTVTVPEQINPNQVDFGSVFFPSAAITPKQVLKNFRISNAGTADLKIQSLDPLEGDFSIGLVRYGVNSSILCGAGQSPTNPAHNCSINAVKKLMSSNPAEREILTLPPSSPVHIDAVVSYFPTDFVSPDEASFVVHPQTGSSRQVSLKGVTESNPAALVKVYMDKTPGAPGNDDIAILHDARFNFGSVTSVALKIQNGGSAGGDRLKIRNADIQITGGGGRFTFTPASPSDPPPLEAPENFNEGRVVFGSLQHSNVGAPRIDTAALTILGHSLDSEGTERPGDIVYTTTLMAGAYDGEITFKATRMMAGINNPALISKPSVADVDARIGFVFDPNNAGKVQLKKIISRPPNDSELPGYQALNNAGRLAFMQTIAPLRASTTSLGYSDPPACQEGNFDGNLAPTECSYFFYSLAGNSSDFSNPLAVNDSDPEQSDYEIDPVTAEAMLTLRDLALHIVNPEHKLLGSIGDFDERLRLSFGTEEIDPSLIYFSSSAAWSPPLDLVSGNGVNQPPLQTYINQNDNSDGIPGNRRGILSGRSLNFTTGHAVLAGVSKFSNSAPFFVQGAEIYIVIEGDFCGGNTGRSCD